MKGGGVKGGGGGRVCIAYHVRRVCRQYRRRTSLPLMKIGDIGLRIVESRRPKDWYLSLRSSLSLPNKFVLTAISQRLKL